MTRRPRARAPGARDVALAALLRVDRDRAFLAAALDAEIERAGPIDPRDRALATELAYGTMRRRLRLDYDLAFASDRTLDALDPTVLAALRLGAYQLGFTTRVPARAAVHETVETLKRSGFARAAGFANAVLRKLARGSPPLPQDPIERVSVVESHPRWLLERWLARLGSGGTESLCAANNEAPPVCLRANSARISAAQLLSRLRVSGTRAEKSPVSPLGVRVAAGGPVDRLAGFEEGLWQVQDDAAQLVALFAGVRENDRVLDVCAAPGGKTCHFAAAAGTAGFVAAVDLNPRKLAQLRGEAGRLGLSGRVAAVCADATSCLPVPESHFDVVVVDAPCSGLGTLRRHPELRYRRRPEDLPRLAALQRAMLARAAEHVRPGGTLVYAVCTPEPEETDEGVAAFLASDSRFVQGAPPEGFSGPVEAGALRTWPHRHGADAFFAVRLTRS